MNRYKYLSVAALSLLLLASCGSSGIGDVLGTGSNQNAQLRGTVDSVDINSHSIYLVNVSNYNNSMLSSSGNAVRVYYDNNTTVQYQGRAYRPEDLERGDQVDVNAQQSGNQLAANSITVVSDVRTSGTYPGNTYPGNNYPNNNYPNNNYPNGSTMHGTVTYVDTSRQTIQVDTGYNNVVTLAYNSSTPVYWNGQTYRAADLERGDEVDIHTSTYGNGGLLAQDITVTRNVSNGGYGTSGGNGTYGSSTQTSTVRGTVQYVDTTNRTIQIASTTWIAGFNPGTRTSSGTILVHYDPNTQVNVRGSMYPVSGLERGDVIEVSVQNLGSSNVLAQQIWLVQDVNNRM